MAPKAPNREHAAPMKIFRQSLRSKLIGVFLLPTLLIVALYGSLAYFASRQGLEDELGERLVAVGQTLSAQWSEGFDAKQLARLDENKGRVIARLHQELVTTCERTGVRRVAVFDRAHRSLVDSDPAVEFGAQLYDLEPHGAEVRQVFAGGTAQVSVLFSGPDELLYKTGFVPITSDGEVVAVIGVEASASFFDLLTEFASVLTGLAVLAILLIVLVATVFSRRLVAPINRLVEAARRLGRGEFHAPIPTSEGEDEIAFLSQAFEDMLQDIVGRDAQMQMMLSGIAHEVRNPLGGMELFCGLLVEDLKADTSQPEHLEMIEKVGKIQRELSYLDRVVNDFLDFARNVPLELERFDARTFVVEVDDLLRGEVVDAACTLEIEAQDIELTADRQKLRRALINIIRNALQACSVDGNGEIRVSVGVTDDGQRVIEVRDNGPGIPTERIDEVLTPFYTTKEKGSGLGLALTRRILEQHRGTLEISATPGGGATVRLVFPYDPDVAAVPSSIPEGWLG